MPPHLHPRSRLTSSLFATTLFFSFFVVSLPHVLPCPAPRVAFADGESPDGQPQRRRRRRKCVENEGEQRKEGSAVDESSDEGESTIMARIQGPKPKRECPVPKPGGMVGELLGFKPSSDGDEKRSKPP